MLRSLALGPNRRSSDTAVNTWRDVIPFFFCKILHQFQQIASRNLLISIDHKLHVFHSRFRLRNRTRPAQRGTRLFPRVFAHPAVSDPWMFAKPKGAIFFVAVRCSYSLICAAVKPKILSNNWSHCRQTRSASSFYGLNCGVLICQSGCLVIGLMMVRTVLARFSQAFVASTAAASLLSLEKGESEAFSSSNRQKPLFSRSRRMTVECIPSRRSPISWSVRPVPLSKNQTRACESKITAFSSLRSLQMFLVLVVSITSAMMIAWGYDRNVDTMYRLREGEKLEDLDSSGCSHGSGDSPCLFELSWSRTMVDEVCANYFCYINNS